MKSYSILFLPGVLLLAGCSGGSADGGSGGAGAQGGTGADSSSGASSGGGSGGSATGGGASGGSTAGTCKPDGVCDRTEDCKSCLADCGSCNPMPESYVTEVYEYPSPADSVACSGVETDTAALGDVSLAQTHLLSTMSPLFFLIAKRPALLVASVTGAGPAPEVSVEGFISGASIGKVCMAGPSTLPATVGTDPRQGDRFTVTLPKSWVQPGLSLVVKAGSSARTYSADTLKVGHAPDLNLVMLSMHVLNYNSGATNLEPSASFLGDTASAYPASTLRFSRFPAQIELPEILGSTDVANALPVKATARACGAGGPDATYAPCASEGGTCSFSGTKSVAYGANGSFVYLTATGGTLCSSAKFGSDPAIGWPKNCYIKGACQNHGISDSALDGALKLLLGAMQQANGESSYSVYFGNTEQFNPGGWGGGRSFTAADFGGVFLHEQGHALSLPHWGDAWNQAGAPSSDYNYPYGGISNVEGSGRGDSWNYYQNINEFTSPRCELTPGYASIFGLERSDAMQRTNACPEKRSTGEGPWDGFGDFSSLAMFRFLTGAPVEVGAVPYASVGGNAAYQLSEQPGWPNLVRNADGTRELVRSKYQPSTLSNEEKYSFLHPQKWDVPVHMVFGTIHPDGEANNFNVVYAPVSFVGNLPEVVDPTDPTTFAKLKAQSAYGDYWYWDRDYTFKFIYSDGTELHALYPYGNISRDWTMGTGMWRDDLLYFAINVPGEKTLSRVEIYHRPFCVQGAGNNRAGNINYASNGITAQNFMTGAVLVTAKNF